MIELELTRICPSTFMPLGKIFMVGAKFKVWTADEKRGKVEREVTYVDGVPVDEWYVDVVDVIQQHLYLSNYTKRKNFREHGYPLGDPEA
jgi:hypothetical protein